MKNLTIVVVSIILLFSCSSGSDVLTPDVQSLENTIKGKTWKQLNYDYYGYWFYLDENQKLYEKFYLCDTLEENGVWEIDGTTITHIYTEGPLEYSVRWSIKEFNDSIIKFQVDTMPEIDVNLVYEIVENEVIFGCMDSSATNFNPNAVCSSDCLYDGCTNEDAFNYNPLATSDDGSCCYVAGCTDQNATNYDSNACFDDGTCFYVGCTDNSAYNFNPFATSDDGSCCYIAGCTDQNAMNYDSNACFDDGSCNLGTYIPDDNFEEALIVIGYDLVMDDYVNTQMIENITELDLSSFLINDLTGIEDFTSLEILDLSKHPLEFGTISTPLEIDVSNNINLKHLNLNNNCIINLDVTNNTNLEYLNLTNNHQLEQIDLSQNQNLIEFHGLCKFSSIDFSNNINLEKIYSLRGTFTELDFSNNINLKYLRITHSNEISFIDISDNLNLLSLSINTCIGINSLLIPTSLISLYVDDSPNLSCITVDNLSFINQINMLGNNQLYFDLSCP